MQQCFHVYAPSTVLNPDEVLIYYMDECMYVCTAGQDSCNEMHCSNTMLHLCFGESMLLFKLQEETKKESKIVDIARRP